MIEKLRQLKKKSHMTNQQIAEKSNIPESTVARIFSGKTPNPTIATVISMTRAMGGSVADLLIDEDGTGTEDELSEISEAEMQDCGKEVAVDKSPLPYRNSAVTCRCLGRRKVPLRATKFTRKLSSCTESR